ncbi:hypothetical protein JXA56_02400 [Candidatus Micrarchaeota archaeon]|nr:hypothetical protein [Candidatus Micrarchaeota archaeon]
MYNEILTNKKMASLIVVIQLLLLGALIFYPNPIIALIAILTFVIAAAVWRFGFLLKPMISKHLHILEGFGKYELTPSQDVIIKKEGNRYYATAYLLVQFTQSAAEKTADQIYVMKQSYERALSSLNYVYKISNMICPIDLTPFVDKIKERRSKAESRMSEIISIPPSSNTGAEIALLKREIESCEKQLDKIQSGERPMQVINFAMTTASSHSKDDAISKVKQQAAEMKTVISSTLDTEVLMLGGDEMKRCFEWEYMLPEKERKDEFLY